MIKWFIACLATSSVVARKFRLTAVGDSITEGGGCTDSSYVDVLGAMLGEEYEVFNAGKSSMTMLKRGLCNDLTPCSYWDTGTPCLMKISDDLPSRCVANST